MCCDASEGAFAVVAYINSVQNEKRNFLSTSIKNK